MIPSYNTTQAKKELELSIKSEARNALEAALDGKGPLDGRVINEHLKLLNAMRRWENMISYLNQKQPQVKVARDGGSQPAVDEVPAKGW